jgi:4-hydroxy-3-methylbut-2-enyl diphosphate reductase
MGFCWGVRRAIDIIETAAEKRGEIVSLGPIVHNPQVVRQLRQQGIRAAHEFPNDDTLPVAITAHGAGPTVLEDARTRGAEIIDTTCPIVTRSQRWAKKMAEAGFAVVIFGDPKHREVQGVLAWAGPNGVAVSPGDSLPDHLPTRLAVIAQTTQSPHRFADFLSTLIQNHVSEFTELRVINTLCDVTSSQQAATRDLAQEVDLMIVVGGRASANTRHLLDICEEEGTTAYHVESPAELKPAWLRGRSRVGVTAGTSTPDSAVEAVVRHVQRIAAELESAASRG